jgi:hypothetical protein
MIAGTIVMEDTMLTFSTNHDSLTVTFTVADVGIGYDGSLPRAETRTVPQAAFFAALAIAVHNDGMPDAEADYPAAESVMGAIRWIP